MKNSRCGLDCCSDTIRLAGITKTSLIDYPGMLCSVVFLAGCNFRCPYCHNRDIVLRPDQFSSDRISDLLDILRARLHLVDAVCVTGGEPTLSPNLIHLAAGLKRLGLKVKLDTNGTKPEVVKELMDRGLLDYVAMDIKAPPKTYEFVTRTRVDLYKIHASIDLLRRGNIQYEFRTTVVPKIIGEKDMLEIGQWLKGSRTYVLQQFRPKNTLDESFEKVKPYPRSWLRRIADMLRGQFEEVIIRSI